MNYNIIKIIKQYNISLDEFAYALSEDPEELDNDDNKKL